MFFPLGNSVVGEKGELVICTPNPAFPVAVWNDAKGRKLEELYLSKFPGKFIIKQQLHLYQNNLNPPIK